MWNIILILCVARSVVSVDLPAGSPPKGDDGIITINNQNWNNVVMSPEHDVVVEFFSPTCIYCIRFEPIWKEVAGHFKDEDSILITRIDASRPDGNIPDIEITGVPTVIIFPAAAKDRPLVYTDQRSASLIVEWILEKAHLPVEVHISYKSEPIPSSPKNGNVIEVVGLNWKSVVLNPDKDVFVNFYAPWCPYSNMLQPTWSQLEQRLRSVPTITIAQFDGTANEVPGLHLHAFPTMTLYRAGNNEQRPYRGNQRTVEAFIEFLQKETLREWTDPETGITNSHVEHVEKDHAVDVPELNDDNYLQTIQDKDKNVVVLFYAPWCEHSQELFSTWEEIYMDYRSIRTVSVVQIDATKYKSPQISIYPTIKIFPASNLPKDTEGITFKGKETTARNIKEFIQTNAVRPSVEIKIQEAHLEASKKGLPPPTENELEAQHGIDFPEIDYSSGQSLLYRQKTDL